MRKSSSFGADIEEVARGDFFQRGPGFGNALKIFADDSGVDLADRSFGFTSTMILNLELIEALVRFAAAQRGDMRDRIHGRSPRRYTRGKAEAQIFS